MNTNICSTGFSVLKFIFFQRKVTNPSTEFEKRNDQELYSDQSLKDNGDKQGRWLIKQTNH